MNYPIVLFDLDGTLTDPKEGITKSVQYALSRFDIHVDNLDQLDNFVGPPLLGSFIEAYSFSETEAKKAIEHYRVYFRDRGIFENKLYAGIPELLQMLKRQNRTLVVATSKPTVFAEKVLKHFELDAYFDYVCGSHLDGTLSDKSEIIKHIIDANRYDNERMIMIGDRKHDIIGAHNNGVASIGVVYGYGSEEELAGANPTYFARNVQELAAIFSS